MTSLIWLPETLRHTDLPSAEYASGLQQVEGRLSK